MVADLHCATTQPSGAGPSGCLLSDVDSKTPPPGTWYRLLVLALLDAAPTTMGCVVPFSAVAGNFGALGWIPRFPSERFSLAAAFGFAASRAFPLLLMSGGEGMSLGETSISFSTCHTNPGGVSCNGCGGRHNPRAETRTSTHAGQITPRPFSRSASCAKRRSGGFR